MKSVNCSKSCRSPGNYDPAVAEEAFRVPWSLRLVVVLGGLLATGCGREQAPSAKLSNSASTKTDVASKTDERPSASASAARKSAEPTSSQVKLQDDASEAPEIASNGEKAKPAADSTEAAVKNRRAERIAILTPGGPLLVDVFLTIGGRSHTEIFDAAVKKVLDAGDTDGDEKSTWKEIAANHKFLNADYPNAPPADSRQMKTLIERYDENRDGNIQPGEAAAWLGRDAGTSVRALALRSARSYSSTPRATSHLWKLLDADHNGRLTRREIESAPQRLSAPDADDDGTIVRAELASLREQLEAAAGQQATTVSRETNQYAAIHLEQELTAAERLQFLLSDLYAPQQDLTTASFSQMARLANTLDANSDNWLEPVELADMFTVEPDLKMTIEFGTPTAAHGAAARVIVRDAAPELSLAAQPSADRAVLSLGGTRLIISAHDLRPKRPADPNAPESDNRYAARADEIHLMVHDQCDALFEELDANADGKLGERELAAASARLLERDANADGQLTSDELPYSMIVAFLLGENPGEQSFYVPQSMTTAASGIEPPAWFEHADLNGDGDISAREFVGSTAHFSKLDANRDGYVGSDEAAAIK
jgi:hypothetical protein